MASTDMELALSKKVAKTTQVEELSPGTLCIKWPSECPRAPKSNGHASILKDLTLNLAGTYAKCSPEYHYSLESAPRRVLTKDSEGVHNNKHDNALHDYICRVSDEISTPEGEKFEFLGSLGCGTFGQVLKCKSLKSGEHVAVKIVKNTPGFFRQALCEAAILQTLVQRFDPEEDRFIRMMDCFVYRKHVCMVFEMLSVNLYDVLKQNKFRGVPYVLIRTFTKQLLRALQCLRAASIIHADVKPENILLVNKTESTRIKLIDFGSSCFEDHQIHTYIQSRFYRAPEVMLGLPYTGAIDMWSLGCVCAELWIGLPIFPGRSVYEQFHRVDKLLGLPPDHMLENRKEARRYFCKLEATSTGNSPEKSWRLQTTQEFGLKAEPRFNESEPIFKEYYPKSSSLGDLIGKTQGPILPTEEERCKFSQFLTGVLQIDPDVRWKPRQCLEHSFVQRTPFCLDFHPEVEAYDGGTPSSAWNDWVPQKPIAIDISGGDTPLNKTLKSFCLEFDPPPRSKAQVATEDKAEDDEVPVEAMLETVLFQASSLSQRYFTWPLLGLLGGHERRKRQKHEQRVMAKQRRRAAEWVTKPMNVRNMGQTLRRAGTLRQPPARTRQGR